MRRCVQQAGVGGNRRCPAPGQVQVQGPAHDILTVFNYLAATSATYHCPSSPSTQSWTPVPILRLWGILPAIITFKHTN